MLFEWLYLYEANKLLFSMERSEDENEIYFAAYTQPSLGLGWGIGAPAEAWLQYEWKGLALIVFSAPPPRPCFS